MLNVAFFNARHYCSRILEINETMILEINLIVFMEVSIDLYYYILYNNTNLNDIICNWLFIIFTFNYFYLLLLGIEVTRVKL